MSVKNAKPTIPPDSLELYDQVIQSIPKIERKGVSMPYTSVNGHMFTHLSKEGIMGIRLPKDEREAFLQQYNTSLFEQHGTVLKEFATVPESLLKNTDELKKYVTMSYEYALSLKPKPTRKKK